MPLDPRPVKYKLTGTRRGHSGRFFGFEFKDGVCVISGEAHHSIGHVLQEHYAAFPEAEADKKNAEDEAAGIQPAPQSRGPQMAVGVSEMGDDGSLKPEVAAAAANAPPVQLPPRASKKK